MGDGTPRLEDISRLVGPLLTFLFEHGHKRGCQGLLAPSRLGSADMEPPAVPVDFIKSRSQNLAVAHGSVEAERHEQPGVRVLVSDCALHE